MIRGRIKDANSTIKAILQKRWERNGKYNIIMLEPPRIYEWSSKWNALLTQSQCLTYWLGLSHITFAQSSVAEVRLSLTNAADSETKGEEPLSASPFMIRPLLQRSRLTPYHTDLEQCLSSRSTVRGDLHHFAPCFISEVEHRYANIKKEALATQQIGQLTDWETLY